MPLLRSLSQKDRVLNVSINIAKGISLVFIVGLSIMISVSTLSLYPEEWNATPILKFSFNPFILISGILVFVWGYLNPSILLGNLFDFNNKSRSETQYRSLIHISMAFMLVGVTDFVAN